MFVSGIQVGGCTVLVANWVVFISKIGATNRMSSLLLHKYSSGSHFYRLVNILAYIRMPLSSGKR